MSTINAAGTVLTVEELSNALTESQLGGGGPGRFEPIEVRFEPAAVNEAWDATVTGVAATTGGVELTVQIDRDDDVADELSEFVRELTECANIAEVRNVLASARTHGELRRYFP
jgi:hypothetical protein